MFRIVKIEVIKKLNEQRNVKNIITLLPENIVPVKLKNKPVKANEKRRKVINKPTIEASLVKFHAMIEKDSTSNHLAILLIKPAKKRSRN